MLPATINNRVVQIQQNEQDINCFVEEYKPFICACVEKVTGRYTKHGEDDEFSIALMAFVEAVKKFNGDKGSFLSFAQNVIKNRLIDYFRKEKKHKNIVFFNKTDDDKDESVEGFYDEKSIQKFSEEEISEYRRLELEELKKELKLYDISFHELLECSPKYDKTRITYRQIIDFVKSRQDLIDTLRNKRCLPIKEIESELLIPRKTIERSRKYIIAVLVILTGDYQYIKDFIE